MAASAAVEDGEHLARVIPLRPVREKSCLICIHAQYKDMLCHASTGELQEGDETFCGIDEEFIDSETYTANNCPAYVEDKDAT